MEKKLKSCSCLLAVFIISAFINISGIKWGLPGQKTLEIVAGEKNLVEKLAPIMVETRDEIRNMVKIPGDQYTDFYDENRSISVYYDNKILNLTFGQINAIRTYFLRTYYPDEHTTITALTNIDIRRKQLNPKVLIPGSFHIYASGLWLGILHYLGVIRIEKNVAFYILNPEEMGKIYLWMRIFILISFFLSVYLIWITGKLLWNDTVGLMSSLLFGMSPVLNLWNHFGYYYSFSLPFVILSFLFSVKNFKENNSKNWILAGIFSGISASVVSLYGISIIFLFVCFVMLSFRIEKIEGQNIKKIAKQLFAGLLSFFLTFTIINIFILIDIKTLLKLTRFEQGDFVFSIHPFLFIFGSLKTACGWPFLIASILGFILSIKQKKDKYNLALAISILAPLILLFSFSPWYARRAIFLIPFMALLASIFLNYMRYKNKILGNILTFLVLFLTFLYSASYTKIFKEENIRDVAGKWININIPEGTSIGLLQMPAPYRTPPFQFYKYKLVPISWDKQKLEKEKPEYFIVSEYELLGQSEGKVNNFFSEYYIIKHFKKPASIFGITFNRTKFSVKDFWPPNPEIIIYRRKDVER